MRLGFSERKYHVASGDTLYNLRVADFHTYFVGCTAWGWSLWAHNVGYRGKAMDAKALAEGPAASELDAEDLRQIRENPLDAFQFAEQPSGSLPQELSYPKRLDTPGSDEALGRAGLQEQPGLHMILEAEAALGVGDLGEHMRSRAQEIASDISKAEGLSPRAENALTVSVGVGKHLDTEEISLFVSTNNNQYADTVATLLAPGERLAIVPPPKKNVRIHAEGVLLEYTEQTDFALGAVAPSRYACETEGFDCRERMMEEGVVLFNPPVPQNSSKEAPETQWPDIPNPDWR